MAQSTTLPFTAGPLVWMDGALVRWDDAKIHITSHVIHYGSGVFEGIRVYHGKRGSEVFRLREHLERLLGSAKIFRMEHGYSLSDLTRICLETVTANGMPYCYIRPIIYRGYGNVGVNPIGCPVNVAVAIWEWGAYLGAEGLEQGIDVKVSTWTRVAPNTLPMMAKSSANYLNGQMIKAEARLEGYSEGVALNVDGTVSEGSGENLFLVHDGALITPPLSSSILGGITRRTVMALANDLGIPVHERVVPREMLYLADELFFCGTAAEITPIRSVDRIAVGAGKRGPITEAVQKAFFAIVRGEVPDRHGWLTPVPVPQPALK